MCKSSKKSFDSYFSLQKFFQQQHNESCELHSKLTWQYCSTKESKWSQLNRGDVIVQQRCLIVQHIQGSSSQTESITCCQFLYNKCKSIYEILILFQEFNVQDLAAKLNSHESEASSRNRRSRQERIDSRIERQSIESGTDNETGTFDNRWIDRAIKRQQARSEQGRLSV